MSHSCGLVLGICAFALAFVCDGNCGDAVTPTESSSELLLNWKHAQRITLDMEKADPDDVFKEIERQSGVQISNWTGRNDPITLQVKDAPIWQVLAEASKASGTGLETGGFLAKSKSVDFVGRTRFPAETRPRVLDRYQILGPFLIGMCWSSELLKSQGKSEPALMVRVLSFRTETRFWPGIQELALRDAKGKRYPLKTTTQPRSLDLTQVYAVVPAGLEKEKMDLCGSFEGQVYLNPKEFVVPIRQGHVSKLPDFGGLTIRVVKVAKKNQPSVECVLQWNVGLRGQDAKILDKISQVERSYTLSAQDIVKYRKWLKSKSAETRFLEVLDFNALDKNKKIVGNLSRELDSGIRIRLALAFARGYQPVNLKMCVAESKEVTGVFEFKNVFSR